jgi:hypothetical protein
MRRFCSGYLLLLVFLPIIGYSQISDSFDKEEVDPNIWKGDSNDFIIDENRLRLHAPSDKERSTLWIKTPDLINNTQWNIDIELDFNPSGQNFLNIWFAADTSDVTIANGIFISIGENGSDDAINIFHKEDGEEFVIATGAMGSVAERPKISIQINRSENEITLLSSATNSGNMEELVFFTDLSSFDFFLIDCHYTSTRSDKFYFDNFYAGPIIVDNSPPRLNSFEVFESCIVLNFNESIEDSNVGVDNFSIIPNWPIREIGFVESNKIKLIGTGLFLTEETYSLSIKDIRDLSGNSVDTLIEFSLLPRAEPGLVILNEILFNPIGNGSDFVEIYNNSDKTISLSGLYLGNTENQQREKIISPESIGPEEYVLFTEDKENVMSTYPSHSEAQIFEQSLPSFNNNNGNVSLGRMVDNQLMLIDGYDYSEKHHLVLQDDEDGVSLERVNFNATTNDKDNWTSAASIVGFGTPGIKNSASNINSSSPDQTIIVNNNVFSPDSDGNDDFASFSYELLEKTIGNATVFDVVGQEVKKLWNNESIPTLGTVTWDGTDNGGNLAKEGIYIIVFEFFNLDGKVKRIKEDVVLVKR